jgi:hypothetical protein
MEECGQFMKKKQENGLICREVALLIFPKHLFLVNYLDTARL